MMEAVWDFCPSSTRPSYRPGHVVNNHLLSQSTLLRTYGRAVSNEESRENLPRACRRCARTERVNYQCSLTETRYRSYRWSKSRCWCKRTISRDELQSPKNRCKKWLEPRRAPSKNWTDTPDPCPYGPYRASIDRRSALRLTKCRQVYRTEWISSEKRTSTTCYRN